MLRKNMNMKPAIRYSPKPMSEYTLYEPDAKPSHKDYGATRDSVDFLLNEDYPMTWNLAYLSHPFELGTPPSNLDFFLWCSRTVRYSVFSGAVSYNLKEIFENPDRFIGGMLLKPAPLLVKWLDENRQKLYATDMYNKGGGHRWLHRIQERAWQCATYDEPDEPKIRSVADARKLLQAFKMPTR